MDLSDSIQVVLHVAKAEVLSCRNTHLEPEHIFLGICKLDDFNEVADLMPQVKDDIRWLSKRFQDGRVSRTRTRRILRSLMRRRPRIQGKFTGHRSDRCRELFRAAADLADEEGRSDVGVRQFVITLIVEQSPVIEEAIQSAGSSWSALRQAFGLGAAKNGAELAEEEQADAGASLETPSGGSNKEESDKKTHGSSLEAFGRDLTALARKGRLPPCIGRKDEMRQVAQILRRKAKSNPVLVGDPGVGKTCIVEGLAQRVASDNAPAALRDLRIFEIDIGSMLSGAMYRGQFEERLKQVVDEASRDSNLVIFIDELHTVVGAGGSSSQGIDAGQMLKPALARGDMRVIGATTTAEYRKYIESDAALERRFQMVWVNEPSEQETIEILMGLKPGLEEHHGLPITDEAFVKAVEFSMRFLPEHRLPDKAIDLIDQACSARMLATLSYDPTAQAAPPDALTSQDLATVVAKKCQIPVGLLTADEQTRLSEMETILKQRVIGQDEAIGSVSAAVRSARLGLRDETRPAGVFLLLGPTGVGKTETAKALAEFLFGSERALIRFDMSEFKEKHDVAKLIGAPPGYIGHDEEGQLISKVRTRPYSVILLDEVEKAHPEVYDLLLQVFDEGRLTDAKGRRASFRESIIVMTSNLGCRVVDPSAGGGAVFGFHPRRGGSDDGEGLRSTYSARTEHIQAIKDEVRRFFRPEFLNRIQEQIVFRPLTRDVLRSILGKLVAALNDRLKDKQIAVRLSAEAEERLINDGYDDVYGARALERIFDKQISQRLAADILNGRASDGKAVLVDVGGAGYLLHVS